MEWLSAIVNFIPYMIVLIILIIGAIALFQNSERSAREWLLLAVTEAEKVLGGGTGKLKLRQVWEHFVKIYPTFSKFISFDTFSYWVDVALGNMRTMIEDNKSVEIYVKGDNNGDVH